MVETGTPLASPRHRPHGNRLVACCSAVRAFLDGDRSRAAAGWITSPSAAGSCWEIKQNTPSAAGGIYWLVTPALQAPEQFYCDKTTDGGGWVLVGRGRENWKQAYAGLGTTQQVRENITGQPAFNARQLSSKTIDGLLNGGRVDALTEGIRLRRARDEGGTTWQEVRFKFTSRDRWVWTFPAEHRVSTYSFDGVSGSGGKPLALGPLFLSSRRYSSNCRAVLYLGLGVWK